MFIIIQSLQLTNISCNIQFNRFIIQYNKKYDDEQSQQLAKETFCQNLIKIQTLKQQYPDVKLHINEFSDEDLKSNDFLIKQKFQQQKDNNVRLLGEEEESTKQTIKDPYYDENTTINTYNRKTDLAQLIKDQSDCQKGQGFVQSKTLSPNQFILTDLFEQNGTDVIFKTDIRSADLTSHISQPYSQNTCGSCYAFSSLVHFETLFWKDYLFYKQNSDFDYFTKNATTENLRLSAEYLMDNTYPTNQQCGGGTFIFTASLYGFYQLPTVELASTFPYDSMFSSSECHYNEKSKRNTTLTESQYLNLGHVFSLNSNDCQQTVFNLYFKNQFNTSGEENATAIVMSILARGIAVIGQMDTEGTSDPNLGNLYNFYSGGILPGDCTSSGSNHQITFVGFGTYKGTNVWLIQNSYGRSWGENGYFYVERGKNSFCTENMVSFTMNRYYRYSQFSSNNSIEVDGETIDLSGRDDSYWENSQEFKYLQSKGILKNINEKIFKRGINGLDFDDGTFKEMKRGPMLITLIVILILTLLIILYFTGIWMCCPPPVVIMPTVYIRFNHKQLKTFDWSKSSRYIVYNSINKTYPLEQL